MICETSTNDFLHELFRGAWENLLKQLAQREQRLHAAGEIHRFHRDVAEALFRIQVSREPTDHTNSFLTHLTSLLGQERSLINRAWKRLKFSSRTVSQTRRL